MVDTEVGKRKKLQITLQLTYEFRYEVRNRGQLGVFMATCCNITLCSAKQNWP